ncbi:hypothetical protein N0V82_002380 [Gnomoniopsis sp. IMI 355080]|nr:hypothetical protein N0V82_002380 [Gnomoniopsis sp. IMI 355080]
MRVLCLHGAGTSASIFEKQTGGCSPSIPSMPAYSQSQPEDTFTELPLLAAFRALLPQDQYIFEFVDAPHASGPAPGIGTLFSPPYYTFYRSQDASEVKASHEWILQRLTAARATGTPFDALMCFSQGCAAAAGLIIQHQNERPHEPLPFRAAVFICGGLPFNIFEELGLSVPQRAWDINQASAEDLHRKAGAVEQRVADIRALDPGARRRRVDGLWTDVETLSHRATGSQDDYDPKRLPQLDNTDVFGLDLTRLPEGLAPQIPTVHVYGLKDPRYPSAIQLASFCRGPRRVFDHNGGHEIPRNTPVSQEISESLLWLRCQIREV